jgi:hypothetical protein
MYAGFAKLAVFVLFPLACALAQDLISTPSSTTPDITTPPGTTPAITVPPITAAERFKYYVDRTYGWQQMGGTAVSTGIDYMIARPEWGRGIGGFSSSYASSFGRRVVTNSAEFGAASALREDIRFRPSRRIGFVPRLKYATAHAFLAYGPSNQVEPGYARFVGITGVALIEPTWHPAGLTGASFGKNVGLRSLDQVEQSMLTEFGPDLKRLSQRLRKKYMDSFK